ncbi:DUF3822 family protein [Spirosoma pulveris]
MQIAVTISPTVQISADSFDAGLASKSVLSLEVGRERFRFMVQDSRGQGLYLEDYTFPSLLTERSITGVLPDVFREHPVLSAGPWQEIRIGVNSPSFTLIPAPLFRKEYAGSYLALMRGSALPAHEFAQSYAHTAEGFLSVFNMEHPLADFFSEIYPLQPLVYIHQVGTLIQATADLDRHALTSANVYLFFEDEFVTIICRNAHKVGFCNRFGYKNVQDLTYYILYVFEAQSLAPESTPLFLYGEITPFAEAYAELSRFMPKLTFGQIPPGLQLSSAFEDLPNHRYLSLYGLGLLSE